MSNLNNPIFAVEVRLKNGEVLRLCISSFDQLSYHLRDLNKSLIQEMIIKPAKIADMRQGRYKN